MLEDRRLDAAEQRIAVVDLAGFDDEGFEIVVVVVFLAVQFVMRLAGVEIVFSRAPSWGAEEPWSVTDSAVLRIGALDGDPRYVLDRVRSPFRLRDGRVVIPNGLSRVLRVYSEEGRHLFDIGREGDGPGEIRELADAWPVGERLDWESYVASLVSGSPVQTPRMENLPVRLPYPPAPDQGSIYENQRTLQGRYFR